MQDLTPQAARTIARLEEELETQRLANKELVSALADVEAEKCAAAKARQKSMAALTAVLAEQDSERKASAALLEALRELGEWRADMSLLRNAGDVLRANAIALKTLRSGSDQANHYIKKLTAERDHLRNQLLEAEAEIARLQILVSTPMSIEQRAAESELLPHPSL